MKTALSQGHSAT